MRVAGQVLVRVVEQNKLARDKKKRRGGKMKVQRREFKGRILGDDIRDPTQ